MLHEIFIHYFVRFKASKFRDLSEGKNHQQVITFLQRVLSPVRLILLPTQYKMKGLYMDKLREKVDIGLSSTILVALKDSRRVFGHNIRG